MESNEIQKQIEVQKKTIKDTKGNGWVIILGTIGVLTILVYGLGILILIVAAAWGWDRSSKNNEAKQRLQHLELLQATERRENHS
jgi:hypothetical protein